MAGHKNRVLNQALAREQSYKDKYAEKEERVSRWTDVKEKRTRRIQESLADGVVPNFFTEFIPAVKIESDDPENPGVIAFRLYPYQEEMARRLLRKESVVWAKERQVGASWLLAAVSYWVAAYHPASHVALISMGQRESNELQRKVRFIHNHLPPELYREYLGYSVMEFKDSGSTLSAFPSTSTAGVSFRFSLIIQDEAARHPYGRANYFEYLPTIAQGGQIVICSTANPDLGPSGFFYEMVQETLRGDNDYALVFNGKYTRPEHTDEFYERMRRRYKLGQDEFKAHYPMTLGEAFVGKTGLVYHQFEWGRHVTQVDPRKWEEYDYRLVGIDPGGGDPTAMVVIGVYQEKGLGASGELRWHQPKGGEFYERGAIAPDELLRWLQRWPNLTRIYDGSTGGSTLLAYLRQHYGDIVWPANKDRSGLGTIGSLLDDGHLTLHESNASSIAEFTGYRWLEKTDPNDRQRYKTATPVDNHADAIDARRYAIASFLRKLQQAVAGGYQTPRDKGLTAIGVQTVRQAANSVRLEWR